MALSNGFFTQHFYDSLGPAQRILIDNHVINRLIEAQNKANEDALKASREKNEHPGMERYESEEEFWGEVEDANI